MKKRQRKNRPKMAPKSETTADNVNSWVSSRLCYLEWNFVERVTFPGDTPLTFILFGCGPYIYARDEVEGTLTKESFGLASQLCVFEATNTYVQGVANLHNGFIVAWGGSYLAHISIFNLMDGGNLCRGNVISTGRLITAVRSYHYPGVMKDAIVEVYFADGITQGLAFPFKKPGTLCLTAYKPKRLPLKFGEMITAVHITSTKIYLGTSQGRLLIMQNSALITVTDPVRHSPIRQIVVWRVPESLKDFPNIAILLLFENGSVVSWDLDRITEIKGRFTCIPDTAVEHEYCLAGDMDGNLTLLMAFAGDIFQLRSFRAITMSRITVIKIVNKKDVFIGTNMGEMQWFDLSVMREAEFLHAQPIVSSKCPSFKMGYLFLMHSKLCNTPDQKQLTEEEMQYLTDLDRRNLKMKYLCCTGAPNREIVFVYKKNEYYAHIADHDQGTVIKGSMAIPKTPIIIVQVILMQSYILLQQSNGSVNVTRIGSKDRPLIDILQTTVTGRITAAACLEHGTKRRGVPYKIDIIFSYLDGRTELLVGELKKTGLVFRVPYSLLADKNSYIVSSIASLQHLGSTKFLLLTNKGKLETAVKSSVLWTPELVYTRIPDRDLRPFIGRGHSLMEMSLGIVAAGFKQHTLHVCWISVHEYNYFKFAHLFSVDTRSSRRPFTIIERKIPLAKGADQIETGIVVGYCHKDGYKEDRFLFSKPRILNRARHSGTITASYIVQLDIGSFCAYTGDTDGNVCVWTFDEKCIGNNETILATKLNGSIKGIYAIDEDIAVITSQGDLHIYRRISDPRIRMLARPPYKLGGKVSYIFEEATREDIDMNLALMSLEEEMAKPIDRTIVVVLEGGTLKKVHLLKELDKNGERKITTTIIGKIRITTTIAHLLYFDKNPYIFLLGTDNILTREKLSQSGKPTTKMNWPISTIRMLSLDTAGLVLIGDQQGWMYFVLFSTTIDFIQIDQYHTHEIVDITFHRNADMSTFIVSLDVSGIVVVRKVFDGQPIRPPFVWACPVPSPRKIAIYGERQILVFGKGAASTSF